MPTSYGLDTSTPYTPSAGRVVFVYLRVGSMATEFLGAASVQSDTRRRLQPIFKASVVSVSLAITLTNNSMMNRVVKGRIREDRGGRHLGARALAGTVAAH